MSISYLIKYNVDIELPRYSTYAPNLYNVNSNIFLFRISGDLPYRILKNQTQHLQRLISYKYHPSSKIEILNFIKHIGNINKRNINTCVGVPIKVLKIHAYDQNPQNSNGDIENKHLRM